LNHLIQTIDNYVNSDEPYALQIDGEWGTGKTYFIKENIIPNSTAEVVIEIN
jgi:restriction endonuclease